MVYTDTMTIPIKRIQISFENMQIALTYFSYQASAQTQEMREVPLLRKHVQKMPL